MTVQSFSLLRIIRYSMAVILVATYNSNGKNIRIINNGVNMIS